MLSGTKMPASIAFWISFPALVPKLISFFKRRLVQTYTRPNLSDKILACSDLPLPGGPRRMTLAGLLGPLLLNLILSMRAKSLATST
jgi:hypothetical protein